MCMCATAGMDCPRVRYPQLNDVVEADLAEQGYQVLTDAGQQVDKVIQLYEVTNQLTLAEPHITRQSHGSLGASHAHYELQRRVSLTISTLVHVQDGTFLQACQRADHNCMLPAVGTMQLSKQPEGYKLCALQVLMTRHTVMVVGQTGGGKSVILQTLARSQTKMGKRTTMNVLNPKVQP